MQRVISLAILIFNFAICHAQTFVEHVDGDTITTKQSYFNTSIKKPTSAANDYIGVYQKYISGIRGQSCPMYPSCSNFGLKTFNETNFAAAFVLTSDRLLRCGHDTKHYALTLRPNGFRYLDYPAYDTPPKTLIIVAIHIISLTLTTLNKTARFYLSKI